MRLRVGIIGNHPGWSLLFQQEGIPYSLDVEEIAIQEYSVIIASDEISPTITAQLQEYLKAGGSVLCSGKTFQRFTGVAVSEKFIRYLVPSSRSEFASSGIVDIYRKCWAHPDANEMLDDDGKPSVYVGEFNGGNIIVLPFEAGETALDYRTVTKSFYARHNRLPFEHVSFVSKGAIRRLVSCALELLHHRRNLPYVHSWYYPEDAKSVFGFRIDTDSASQKQIQSLNDFLSMNSKQKLRQQIPATWFIDVKSQKKWLAQYADMQGQEIGIHCYEHKKYKNADDFLLDVKCAIDVMQKTGPSPDCFAAPYGQWNQEIGKATESFGFKYASDFSYDYDNFPSFPYLEGKFSKALQIPVHPISIGGLRRQGFSELEMKEYFEFVLNRKLIAREPCLLYHHPRDGHEEVLAHIFEFVKRNNIPILRMSEFADWWKKRAGLSMQLEIVDSTLKVESGTYPEEVSLHITRGNGSETFARMSSEIDLKGLKWNPRPQLEPLPPDYARIRKFNPWIWLIRAEDFIYQKFFR